jgi:CheY-like chemotaxis protein
MFRVLDRLAGQPGLTLTLCVGLVCLFAGVTAISLKVRAQAIRRLRSATAEAETLRSTLGDLEAVKRELVTAKDLADADSRAKSTLLANMSREIRTPMNAMLGMTTLLLDTPLSDDQRKLAKTVIESGESLIAIVSNILDISKLEFGKFDTEIVNFGPDARVAGSRELPDSAGVKSSALSARPLRILVAEDNQINQTFAVALLQKAGHAIEIVDNGRQAIEAMRRSTFDVVLMDAQMPELDGKSATREIRNLPWPKCSTPIIAMTADVTPGAERECLEAGMNDYVSKPVQSEVLFAKLARVAKTIEENLPRTQSLREDLEGAATDTSQAPVAADQVRTLDFDRLEDLQRTLRVGAVRDLLLLYMLDTDNHLALIRQQRLNGDRDGIARNAHVIASTAGNVGAEKVCALARALDGACRTEDDETVSRQVEALMAASVMTSDAIRAWLKDGVASARTRVGA